MSNEPLVVVKQQPFNAEAPLSALREMVTPTEQFYVRSNFEAPGVAAEAWRLRVGGAVGQPVELALADLRAMPARTLTATLECAGNGRTAMSPLPVGEPWAFGAVSTAVWRGALVRDILQPARLSDSVVEVLFEGADGGPREGKETPFARSLPLAKALHPDTLLVYEFNGAPLPSAHGGPMRLLVPGWYGMASVKWLVGIEALEEPFAGHFQIERYVLDEPDKPGKEPVREIRVRSLITRPAPGELLQPGRHTITGVAWSGAGKITGVEASLESDSGWQPATLVGEAAPYTWQQWEYQCEIARPGRYAARSRATDERGNRQPHIAAWNRLGYANNAVQLVIFEVQGQGVSANPNRA